MENNSSGLLGQLDWLAGRWYHRMETWTQGNRWWVSVALSCTVLSLLFSFPDYTNPADANIWGAFEEQIDAPFEPRELSPTSHESKRAFRLTMPVIGHLTGLGVVGLLVLQHILGFFFFGVFAGTLHRITGDKVLAWLVTLAVAFVYVGKAPFFDKVGWFDGVAFFFLAVALRTDRWWWTGLGVFLAAWTDERALLAAGLVYLFHGQMGHHQDRPGGLRPVLPLRAPQVAVVGALGLYVALRFYLQSQVGLKIPVGSGAGAGPGLIRLNYGMFPLGFLTSIEFLWLAVGLAIWGLWRQKQYLFSLAWLLNMGLIMGVAYMVHDTTRSAAYVFPAVALAWLILGRSEQARPLRHLALVLLVLCFFFATHFVMHQNPAWISPFFPKVLEYF